LLAERVYPHLRMVGPAALIGVSTDAPSTSHIPNALGEARMALDFAHVADRVMPFGRIPFRDMLVRVAATEVRAALPEWLEPFQAADKKAHGSLTATLRAYANADMNVLKTAEALSMHPNTIYARMQKINDITARNPLSYHALTELLLATDCVAER
jgi:sugar diacid utilization regulator